MWRFQRCPHNGSGANRTRLVRHRPPTKYTFEIKERPLFSTDSSSLFRITDNVAIDERASIWTVFFMFTLECSDGYVTQSASAPTLTEWGRIRVRGSAFWMPSLPNAEAPFSAMAPPHPSSLGLTVGRYGTVFFSWKDGSAGKRSAFRFSSSGEPFRTIWKWQWKAIHIPTNRQSHLPVGSHPPTWAG